jgi:hypothetical protein
MPAVSKSQQRLMGIAYALKKGELDLADLDAPDSVKTTLSKLVDSMSLKSLKKFASTSHSGLPDKVSERFDTRYQIKPLYNFLQNLDVHCTGGDMCKDEIWEFIEYFQTFEDVATLSNVSGMGSVEAPTDGGLGSGDRFDLLDMYTPSGELRTGYCDPEKDKHCAKFRRKLGAKPDLNRL